MPKLTWLARLFGIREARIIPRGGSKHAGSHSGGAQSEWFKRQPYAVRQRVLAERKALRRRQRQARRRQRR